MTNKDVETLIRQFVSDLEHALKAQTIETIETTLGRKVANGLKPTKLPGVPAPKRSPGELELLKKKIGDLLRRVPGQSSEQLQKTLRRSGSELALPIKQMLDAKELRCEGVARGRKYWLK